MEATIHSTATMASITSAEEFVALRTSEDPTEYRRAAHEPAHEDVWRDVIHRFPEMKPWVAHNKTVPLPILRMLAADADPEIRASVAERRRLDRPLFELLAADSDPGVRGRLAFNKKLPLEIHVRLCDDPDPLVAEAARAMMARRME